MAHGFTVKPGQTDLKPYVYEAAEALIEKFREELSRSLDERFKQEETDATEKTSAQSNARL